MELEENKATSTPNISINIYFNYLKCSKCGYVLG